MFKKAKLYSLLAITITSIATGLLTALPTLTLAQSSEPELYMDPKAVTDITVKSYKSAMYRCLRQSGEGVTNYKDLREGNWFSFDVTVNVTYFIDGDEDGRINCNNEVVPWFVDYFGWTNTFQTACRLGFNPKDGEEDLDVSVCLSSAVGDNADDSKHYTFIDDTPMGRGQWTIEGRVDKRLQIADDTISEWINIKQSGYRTTGHHFEEDDRQLYLIYMQAFQRACKNNFLGITQPESGSDPYLSVMLVDRDGKASVAYYSVDNENKSVSTHRNRVDGKNGNNDNASSTCKEIAGLLDEESDSYVSAYADWVSGLTLTEEEIIAGTTRSTSGDNSGATPSSCSVDDGIGWFICPISNSIAKGVDAVFDLVKHFLRVEPLSFDTSNSLYNSWSIFRNYANVIFAIIFLVIIYAQITGGLLNAYTIKTMVPRLVVGAILVNASYLICALAVDISNMLGSYLQDLFMDIRSRAGGETADNIPTWETATFYVLSGGTVLTGGVLAVTALPLVITGATSLLWFIVPLLTGAIFSVFVALLVLAARQALITVLIVLSPLAFAAYILPNTQKWFDRWRDLFMTLLIMFPIMSVLFGGSQLAASIIMNSATNIATVFLALGVQVIPLAITPFIIKLSGSLLGRFAGMVNNPNKGPIDRINKWAGSKREQANERSFGTDTPSTWQRLAQRADRRRRRTEERSTVNRKAADTMYDEYASTSPELLELRRRAKELETRSERANDRSGTHVSNSMIGDPHQMGLMASAEEAKLNKKAAEDNLASLVAPLVSQTSRVGEAEAETNKQATEDAIEAGVRRGMNTTLKVRAETSAQDLANAKASDKQVFEELSAAGDSDASLLTAHGVTAATARAAQSQAQDAKAIASATSTARSEGETNYSTALGSDPSLLTRASGNVNPTKGRLQAEARAAAAISKEEDEEVNNTITLMKSRASKKPGSEIRQAVADLEAANIAGDVVSARAAAKILEGAGTKGNTALDNTILKIEGSGSANLKVFNNLKADLKGSKSTNVARDRWATTEADSTGKYKTLEEHQKDIDPIASLNEQELAGQQMNVLEAARNNGTFSDPKILDLVRRTIEQSDNGTIKLDTDKRKLLVDEYAKYNPPSAPTTPPPDPSMRSGTV